MVKGSLLLCHYFQKFSGVISSHLVTTIVTCVLKELSHTLTLIKTGAFVIYLYWFQEEPNIGLTLGLYIAVNYTATSRNHLATVGLLPGDMICRLCGQAPESARHILLECEPLAIRMRESLRVSNMVKRYMQGLEQNLGIRDVHSVL